MGTLTKAIIFFKECQLIVSRQHKAPRQETLKHEIRTFDQLRQTPQTNSNAVTSIKIPTSEKREIAKKHFIQKKRKTSFKTDSNDGFTRSFFFVTLQGEFKRIGLVGEAAQHKRLFKN